MSDKRGRVSEVDDVFENPANQAYAPSSRSSPTESIAHNATSSPVAGTDQLNALAPLSSKVGKLRFR